MSAAPDKLDDLCARTLLEFVLDEFQRLSPGAQRRFQELVSTTAALIIGGQQDRGTAGQAQTLTSTTTIHAAPAPADQSPVAAEATSDYARAKELGDEIEEMAEELLAAHRAQDFAEDVQRGAQGVMATIERNGRVSARQLSAPEGWSRGLERCLGR